MLKAFLDEQHAFALFPTGFGRSSGAQRLATGRGLAANVAYCAKRKLQAC